MSESLLPANRNAEADRSSLNVTTTPTHTLPGSDFVRPLDETSLTDTLILADPKYSELPSGKSNI